MLIRIDEGATLAIPLPAVKKALRVDFSDDDEVIADLIRAETRRYELFTRRIVAPGNYEMGFPGWCAPFDIPAVPTNSDVLAVDYFDADLDRQTLPDADWMQEEREAGVGLRIIGSWPRLGRMTAPVRIAIRVGAAGSSSGESEGAIAGIDPADRTAIIHMVKHQYDHDEVLTEEELRRRFSGRRLML